MEDLSTKELQHSAEEILTSVTVKHIVLEATSTRGSQLFRAICYN